MTTEEKENTPFEGFNFPQSTQVPDDFFDRVMHQLTEAQVRIMLYVFRHTFGYGKAHDSISLSQMLNGITDSDGKVIDYGTGLKSKSAVTGGAKKLVEMGMLLKRRNRSKKRGDEATTYAPKLRISQLEPDSKPSEPVSTKKTGGVHESDTPVFTNQTHNTGTGTVGALTGTGKDDDTTTPTSKLSTLPDLGYSDDEIGMLIDLILAEYKDDRDGKGYATLVAHKVDHQFIHETMASIRQTPGVRKPGALFNHRIEEWAQQQVKKANAAAFEQKLEEIKTSNGAATDGPWKRVGE